MGSWLTEAVADDRDTSSSRNGTGQREEGPAKTIVERVSVADYLDVKVGAMIQCPLPDHPDDDPSFKVYSGGFKCYGCNATGGSVIDLAMQMHRLDVADAVRRLAPLAGVELAVVPPVTLLPDDQVPVNGSTPVEPATEAPDPSSWAPRSLDDVLAGKVEPVVPEVLTRTDGAGLFYRGRYNLLFGASESAKTWVALMAEVQELVAGRRIVHVDLESEATEYVHRMRLLGATDTHLREQVAYIHPTEALHRIATGGIGQADRDLATTFDQPVGLVVIDALGELLDLHGLNPSKNEDVPRVTRFMRRLAEGTRAAVVAIDHIPKADGGTAGPLGAQAKRSAVTGASYSCTASKKPAPGKVGHVVLRVDKDRPGQVRAHCPGGATPVATRITLDSETSADKILWALRPPLAEGEASEALAARMQQVAEVLAELGGEEGLSKNKVRQAVGGKVGLTDDALDRLRADDYIEVRNGARGALVHVLVKPYGNQQEAPTDVAF